MQQSKAGKKLNPIIAIAAAPIFERDKVRYGRLVVWVWRQQKIGWPDEAIAEVLKLANSRIDLADNWWSYLTRLLAKGRAQATEIESTRFKSEVGSIASEFVEFLKSRNSAR